MKKILNKNSFYKNILFVGIIALSLFNLSGAHAESVKDKKVGENIMRQYGKLNIKQENGAFGTVTSISGNTLTVSQTIRIDKKSNATTTKIYTVDASNAKIIKAGATSSLSSILIGDRVSISGTVNGTNITAKMIRVVMPEVKALKNEFVWNGQPVVGGKITSVIGNTILITNGSNVSYTIDASNTKIFINGATSSVANLKVNNEIVVQGTVNGNNITATSIISHQNVNNIPKPNTGFFGKMKNFFGHFFGF